MIEVLFGESEAASMKAAKSTVIVGHVNGPTSVWMAGKKTPSESTAFTGWVEGTADEVVCLGIAFKEISGRWRVNPGMVQRCTIFQMWFLQSVSDTAEL